MNKQSMELNCKGSATRRRRRSDQLNKKEGPFEVTRKVFRSKSGIQITNKLPMDKIKKMKQNFNRSVNKAHVSKLEKIISGAVTPTDEIM